jgi:hypothetical protein
MIPREILKKIRQIEIRTNRLFIEAALGISLSLLFLCSCATERVSHRRLPADVTMNKEAGRGGLLFVTLRLEDGEELPFVMDTGASGTCFDKSLEPKLGERLGTGPSWRFGLKGDAGIYAAPRLYLGSSLLPMTGTNVATLDLKQLSSDIGSPVLGILGMDVLEHYCLQLDFAANKIRFLDAEHTNKKRRGKPFSLINVGDECFSVRENLAGANGPGSLIDTGCDYDGWLTSTLFQQWTNHATLAADGQSRSPNGLLGAETYPNLDLQGLDPKLLDGDDSHMKFNGIGLRFLARHLVTFDFPNRIMYLKRTSVGPFIDKDTRAAGKSAIQFLVRSRKKGRLPGWSKKDKIATKTVTLKVSLPNHYPATATCDHLLKKGDPSVYHYKFIRPSQDSPWKLLKAWRTDQNDKTIEAYPVP